MNLKVKKLHPDAKLPTRAYEGDLGFDLYALYNERILEGETEQISTGIAIEFPSGWGGIIKARSSQGKKGLNILGGVVDQGYRGEIIVQLHNSTTRDCDEDLEYRHQERINAGEKVAQLVLVPVFIGEVEEVTELNETERGEKRYNSSGNV